MNNIEKAKTLIRLAQKILQEEEGEKIGSTRLSYRRCCEKRLPLRIEARKRLRKLLARKNALRRKLLTAESEDTPRTRERLLTRERALRRRPGMLASERALHRRILSRKSASIIHRKPHIRRSAEESNNIEKAVEELQRIVEKLK